MLFPLLSFFACASQPEISLDANQITPSSSVTIELVAERGRIVAADVRDPEAYELGADSDWILLELEETEASFSGVLTWEMLVTDGLDGDPGELVPLGLVVHIDRGVVKGGASLSLDLSAACDSPEEALRDGLCVLL